MSWAFCNDDEDRRYFDLNKEKIYCIEIVHEFDGIQKVEQFGCYKDEFKCNAMAHKMKIAMIFDKPKTDIKLDIFQEDSLQNDLYMAIKREESVKEIRIKETYLRW